ncbi:MAG TPA: hypothetical protein VLF20_04680 [Patescibacteria group bacterium]|nr:hypothetical protein [Patescibacteria group bacterium]
MDKSQLFEFYEILALILPGSVLLFGLSKLFPSMMLFSIDKDFSAGEFGIFIIIAYAVGHIVQVLGGGIEFIWRKFRGNPTEWIDIGKKQLIFDNQTKDLEQRLAKRLNIPLEEFHLHELTRRQWLNAIKQMQISVELAGKTGRLEKFQAIYMMCRGLIATLVILACSSAFVITHHSWYIPYLLLSFAAILLYRMGKFERASVRELVIQFLQLPIKNKE